jgi:hypothetical protein
MCPDRQLLSVYLDGELPSPWKEKMESHLASCPACRSVVETWGRIFGEAGEEDPGRHERVWERIGGRVAAGEAGFREDLFRNGAGFSKAKGFTLSGLWRRRVTLPFPAAALGAMTAAAVALIVSSVWFRSFTGTAVPVSEPAVAALGPAGLDMELRDIRPVNDVSGVLRYLGDTDSNDIVIIRLPESRSFRSAGEPKIIKAADYSQGRPGQ